MHALFLKMASNSLLACVLFLLLSYCTILSSGASSAEPLQKGGENANDEVKKPEFFFESGPSSSWNWHSGNGWSFSRSFSFGKGNGGGFGFGFGEAANEGKVKDCVGGCGGRGGAAGGKGIGNRHNAGNSGKVGGGARGGGVGESDVKKLP